jgi:hypothetical protein
MTLPDIDRLRLRYWLTQLCLLIAITGWYLETITRSPILLALAVWVIAGLIHPALHGRFSESKQKPLGFAILALTLVDLSLNFRNLLDPIVRMGLWVLMARNLHHRNARESLQVLLLSWIMIALNGVISVSVAYLAQLMLFTPLALSLLMLENSSPQLASTRLTNRNWAHFNFLQWAVKLRLWFRWQWLGAFALLNALLWGGVILLFVLLPRVHFPQMAPGIFGTGKTLSGFSESFDLNGLASILPDHSPAFRIDGMVENPRNTSLYWRMLVFDHYHRGRFQRADINPNRDHSMLDPVSLHPMPQNWQNAPQPDHFQAWTCYLEPHLSRFLPMPGICNFIKFPYQQQLEIDPVLGTIALPQSPTRALVFQWQNIQLNAPVPASVVDNRLSGMAFRWTRPDPTPSQNRLTYPGSTLSAVLEEDETQALKHLAFTIANQQTRPGAAGFAEAACTYLQSHHAYSLEPTTLPPPGSKADPVIHWLQHQGKGHCELFAASFALLSRAAGHPCRIITGFAGGEWQENERYLLVRNSNAHAWCEVWAGDQGWFRVDPTPGSHANLPSIADPATRQNPTQAWQQWLETLRMQYYRKVLAFDTQSQVELLESAHSRWKMTLGSIGKLLKSDFWESLKSTWKSPGEPDRKTLTLIAGSLLLLLVTRHLLNRRKKKQIENGPARPLACAGIRKKASHWLKHQSKLPHELTLKLQTLRYGREDTWDPPGVLFRECKRALRRARNLRSRQRSNPPSGEHPQR